MRLISAMKIVMGALLLALLFGLLLFTVLVNVNIATGSVPDSGVRLIATMQDGDVNVYQLTELGFHDCFVIVGQLHGKTVAGVCD